jgi:UDP-N-acetylmuramoyl-L-alanyl-D-glutamate--2,6-diaminopimelate ligase
MDELLQEVEVLETRGDPARAEVTSIALDSRRVGPGALFCCLPGGQRDGHEFAAAALARGAVALLVERPLPLDAVQAVVAPGAARPAMARMASRLEGDPAGALTTVGVTGTNGKTTVTHLLRAVFEAAGRSTEVIGTLSGPRTTPEAPELQRQLARARDDGRHAVAMEVSSHAVAQHRVDGFRFSAAVFTNLGHDHLDYHGTMERYFAAKAALFTSEHTELAVVNADDRWGRRLLDDPSVPTTGFSLSEVSAVTTGPAGTGFRWRGRRVELPLAGSFHVANALAVATTAVVLGVDEDDVVRGLGAAQAVAGRFEIVETPAPFTVVVDYAHTPDALASALASARGLAGGRRVLCVFGCGGDRDRAKRPAMGAVAVAGADVVVVTSDNPRDEDELAIIDEITAGLSPGPDLVIDPDRASAIAAAMDRAGPGDVVVVAGKGHETTIERQGRLTTFDDRREAAAAARRRASSSTSSPASGPSAAP